MRVIEYPATKFLWGVRASPRIAHPTPFWEEKKIDKKKRKNTLLRGRARSSFALGSPQV